MKTLFRFLLPSAVVLMAWSCTIETGPDFVNEKGRITREFSASFDGITKTSLGDKNAVLWTNGDRLTVQAAETSAKPALTVNGQSAVFGVNLLETETWLAASYGAQSITILDEGKDPLAGLLLSGVVGPDQSGLFSDANVSFVYTDNLEDQKLVMKNVTSIVSFSVNDPAVSYIKFIALGGEKLHHGGEVLMSYDAQAGFTPSFPDSEVADPDVVIVRTPLPGDWDIDNPNSERTYYISLLPCTLAGGIRIELYNSSDARLAVVESPNKLVLGKNKIMSLGLLNSVDSFAIDLSAEETANCYIAPVIGKRYMFKATVKGNSTDPQDVIDPASVIVLWETEGKASAPAGGAGSVISGVELKDGCVYFTANEEGSAMIAVRDATLEKNILWSWHIWVWEGFDNNGSAQKYFGGTYMMERNLGAITSLANPSEETGAYKRSWGLLYQWGRKDPFRGASSATTSSWPPAVAASAETGTLEYVAKHPTTYIYAASYANGSDWYWGERKNDLWGSEKTMYDPCPPGWRVPDYDVWSKALNATGTMSMPFSMTYFGIQFGGTLGNDDNIWYGASGWMPNSNNNFVTEQGWYGYWWSNAVNGNYGKTFGINRNGGQVSIQTSCARGYALSVRCMAAFQPEEISVSSVTLDKHELQLRRYQKAVQLTATVKPAAADQSLVWETTNPNVATVENGLVTPGKTLGACDIIVSSASNHNIKDVCTITLIAEEEEDLSAGNKTANCYVVSRPGTYRFRGDVKGNGTVTSIEPTSAERLWETYGTDTYEYAKSVITDVRYENGYVLFTVLPDMIDGNAVIGAKSGNTILWSWHIWVCKDFDPEESAQTYSNKVVMMDRNLGATSIEHGNVKTMGLLYQWGRKDPFPSLGTVSVDAEMAATSLYGDWPTIESSAETGNAKYAREHPTVFIKSSRDWMTTGNTALWGSTKTVDDPCPYGWRVPDGGANGVWAKAFEASGLSPDYLSDVPVDASNCGIDFSSMLGDGVWYPLVGVLEGSLGILKSRTQYGFIWSANSAGANASYCFDYTLGGKVYPQGDAYRATGLSVRCMKIQ